MGSIRRGAREPRGVGGGGRGVVRFRRPRSEVSVPDYHAEVAATLERLGDARLGDAIRKDRGSQLHYFGVRVPALRAAVKRGFSFYSLPTDEVLAIRDAIWSESPHGEVLFAAIEYYMASSRRALAGPIWPVVREWSGRVDNCALGRVERTVLRTLSSGCRLRFFRNWRLGTDRVANGCGGFRSSVSSTTAARTLSFWSRTRCSRWSRTAWTTTVTTCRQRWAGYCARWGMRIPVKCVATSRATARSFRARRFRAPSNGDLPRRGWSCGWRGKRLETALPSIRRLRTP